MAAKTGGSKPRNATPATPARKTSAAGGKTGAVARKAGARPAAAKKGSAAKPATTVTSIARRVTSARRKGIKLALDSSHHMTNQLIDTNRAIWLAGLGAFAKARDTLGARGGHMFDALVKAGQEAEERARGVIETGSDRLKGTVDQMAGLVERNVTHLEDLIDARVETALEKLGVPAEAKFAELLERVRRLSDQVEALLSQRAGKQ